MRRARFALMCSLRASHPQAQEGMLPILYGNDAAESALSLECMQWKVDYIAPGQRPYQVELATHRAKRKAAAAGRRKRVEGLRKAIGRARGRALVAGPARSAWFERSFLFMRGPGCYS